MSFVVENREHVDISRIVENTGIGSIVRLHLASYFRVSKTKQEQEKIYISHGLEPVYDPVRITPEIQEELWEDGSADSNGFFTFPSRRLILGHTLESIRVPADIGLRMREFFYSEKTGRILPLTTNWGAPLIHPGSTGPQTYEIINQSDQPLSMPISELICYLDVERLSGPSVFTQQKASRGEFTVQKPNKIELGNPGKDWEIRAIRKSLGLS